MHYFFHLTTNGQEVLDDSGIELSGVVAARMEGLAALYDLARERIGGVRSGDSVSMRITAEGGEHLGVLRLTLNEVPVDWAVDPDQAS